MNKAVLGIWPLAAYPMAAAALSSAETYANWQPSLCPVQMGERCRIASACLSHETTVMERQVYSWLGTLLELRRN
jgi:hypothetical protein